MQNGTKIGGEQQELHVIEFFFLIPLVVGSFAERRAIIPVFEMMKTKPQPALLQLRDAFNSLSTCHVDDAGAIILPVSSVTRTNHYKVYSA